MLVSILIMDVLDSCNQHIGMAENGLYNIYIYIYIYNMIISPTIVGLIVKIRNIFFIARYFQTQINPLISSLIPDVFVVVPCTSDFRDLK